MFVLFLIVNVLIIYGSIYPFDFVAVDLTAERMERLLDTIWRGVRPGDLLGNVILFVPLGFFGCFAMARCGRAKAGTVMVLVWGLFLGVGLQVVQLYLPSRVPALDDAIWNLLGTGLGAAAGIAGARLLGAGAGAERGPTRILSFPLVLAGCWLAYRLTPFVPSIDWQSFKDSLKPLLLQPELAPGSVMRSLAGWLAFAPLWLHRPMSAKVLAAAIAAVLGLEILIVNNAVTASNMAGAVGALVLWRSVENTALRYAVPALVLAAVIVVLGLEPYTFGAGGGFHWIPFRGFLGGSMYVNAQQVFLKFYLYGSLVWLMWRSGLSMIATVTLVTVGLGIIEAVQSFLPGRTAEISDPLLVLLAAATLRALERSGGAENRRT